MHRLTHTSSSALTGRYRHGTVLHAPPACRRPGALLRRTTIINWPAGCHQAPGACPPPVPPAQRVRCSAKSKHASGHWDASDVRDAEQQQASLASRTLTQDITKAATLVELQDIGTEHAARMDAIHVASLLIRAETLAWAAVPKASEEARQHLAGLIPLWLRLLPDAPMPAVSTLLLAASKVALVSDQLWSASLAHVMAHKQQTTGFDVCNILYAAARVAAANRGQVPGIQRTQVVDIVRTLARRMHAIVLAPREGDRLNYLSVTNCLWALVWLEICPEPDQLTDFLVTATRPQLFGEANPVSYANLLWSLAVLQARPQLFGRVRVPPSAEAALLAEDKVLLAVQGDDAQLRKIVYSLGLLVQGGTLQRGAALQAAGQILLMALETRTGWATRDPAGPLWGAAVLGLPVKQLLTPDMLQQLLAWAPSAKGQYVAPLAELLVLTGCRHDGLIAAAIAAESASAPSNLPAEFLEAAAAVGAAAAHFDMAELAQPLLQLLKGKAELQQAGVFATPHTRQQLQATHAWLCRLQVGCGSGLAGLVHPSLLDGAPKGAADGAAHPAAPGASSSSSSNNSNSRSSTQNGSSAALSTSAVSASQEGVKEDRPILEDRQELLPRSSSGRQQPVAVGLQQHAKPQKSKGQGKRSSSSQGSKGGSAAGSSSSSAGKGTLTGPSARDPVGGRASSSSSSSKLLPRPQR